MVRGQGAQSQACCAFGTRALASGLEPRDQLSDLGLQLGRHGIGVEKQHLVGGRVVHCGQEVRAGGHVDAEAAQVLANGRGIERVGQHAGVNLARLAAAGATVEASGMRVVGAAAAVAGQQH